MEGYVKLHRKSLESAVFRDARLWQVWTWCLMRANHKTTTTLFDGKQMELRPGQFISGRFNGGEACNMPPSTFRNQVERLRKMGNLDIRPDSKKTIFTVRKWAEYQANDNSRTARGTTGGQQEDTDKNGRMEDKEGSSPTSSKSGDEAQSIYEYYVERIRPGNKPEAVRSIRRLLPSSSGPILRNCIDNYSATDMPKDHKFRIQPQNFFGLQERYKEYQQRGSSGNQSGNQNPPRFIDPQAEPWMQ